MKMRLNAPDTPPCHKDRLFEALTKKSSKHQTQIVPNYNEYPKVGHGDPLMQAVMKHSRDMAIQHHTPEKEIHFKQQGSPLCGYGVNDVVHIDKDTIITVPCLRDLDHLLDDDENE